MEQSNKSLASDLAKIATGELHSDQVLRASVDRLEALRDQHEHADPAINKNRIVQALVHCKLALHGVRDAHHKLQDASVLLALSEGQGASLDKLPPADQDPRWQVQMQALREVTASINKSLAPEVIQADFAVDKLREFAGDVELEFDRTEALGDGTVRAVFKRAAQHGLVYHVALEAPLGASMVMAYAKLGRGDDVLVVSEALSRSSVIGALDAAVAAFDALKAKMPATQALVAVSNGDDQSPIGGNMVKTNIKGTTPPEKDGVYVLANGLFSRYLGGQWRATNGDPVKAAQEILLDSTPSPQFRIKDHHRWSEIEVAKTMTAVAGVARSIEAFKQEKANAENRGLLILPSVDGPYVWNPVTDVLVGRKGSEAYRLATSEVAEPPISQPKQFDGKPMSTNYTLSITFEVVTDESVEAGEVAYRGYEREREDVDFDELKRLVRDFGFSEPSCSHLQERMWFSTTTPKEDRAYFEEGERRFFSLHLNAVNGEEPTLEDYADIARMARIKVSGLETAGTRIQPEDDELEASPGV